jgi:hypothetical protein
MARFVALAGLSALLLVASPSAQGLPAGTFDALRLRTPQAHAMRGVLELRAPLLPVSSSSSSRSLRIVSQRALPGTLRRERRPELSADRLLAVTVDAQGHELDWRIVVDPRVVRVESSDAEGLLSGTTLSRPDAELVFKIPDLPGAATVRIYQADLTLIGELVLR